jgi:hypothetical protein
MRAGPLTQRYRNPGRTFAFAEADELVRNEQIVTEVRYLFGLVDRRTGQADTRSRRQLPPRDLGVLCALT